MKYFFLIVFFQIFQNFFLNRTCYSFVLQTTDHHHPIDRIVKRDIETKVDNANLFDIKRTHTVLQQPSPVTTAKPAGKGKSKKVSVLLPGNDLFIGKCNEQDKMLYIDNTVINNNGPSTLNGTIEIYIDAAEPIKITCIHIYDQKTDGTGGRPSYNSGGIGFDWVKIDVQGQYGKGFHFKTYVFGVPDLTRTTTSTTLSPISETTIGKAT